MRDVLDRVRHAPRVWVGTDYDGTLAPVTDDPAAETLGDETRMVLAAVAANPRFAVAVISGRDIANLRARVRLDVAYAGNHGLEIEVGGERIEHPAAVACRSELARVAAAVRAELAAVPGAWVQDKGLSLTVHYQRAPHMGDAVGDIVRRNVGESPPTAVGGLAVRAGHLLWDVRPVADANKGTAAASLRDRQAPGSLAVFLGDDQSDEDAFRALPDGVTILVGDPRPTAAAYRLAGPAAVTAFLRELVVG